jgi:hypothetical protein
VPALSVLTASASTSGFSCTPEFTTTSTGIDSLLRFDSISLHQPCHSEKVEHRFIYTVNGQTAEPFKVRLILELECPRENTLQVRTGSGSKFQNRL